MSDREIYFSVLGLVVGLMIAYAFTTTPDQREERRLRKQIYDKLDRIINQLKKTV